MDERDNRKEGDNMQAVKKIKTKTSKIDTPKFAQREDVHKAIQESHKKHAKMFRMLAK